MLNLCQRMLIRCNRNALLVEWMLKSSRSAELYSSLGCDCVLILMLFGPSPIKSWDMGILFELSIYFVPDIIDVSTAC